MPRSLLAAALIGSLLVLFGARAQELTGTLKKIRDSKTVTLGYRASSIPFSYLNRLHEPIGYSIDLCNDVVKAIASELEGVELAISYKLVRADTRIKAGRPGEIVFDGTATT